MASPAELYNKIGFISLNSSRSKTLQSIFIAEQIIYYYQFIIITILTKLLLWLFIIINIIHSEPSYIFAMFYVIYMTEIALLTVKTHI